MKITLASNKTTIKILNSLTLAIGIIVKEFMCAFL